MVKKYLALLMLLLLLPILALAENPMVVDNAELFTADEISQMEQIITRIRDEYQMDAVVLTTYDVSPNSNDWYIQTWADSYYDNFDYGIDENRSGILYMIDMTNRAPCISTRGDLMDYFNDDRLDAIFESAYNALASGNYGRAAINTLLKTEQYLKQGREEGSFRYDSVTGKRISGIYNPLTPMEMLLAAVAGLVVAFIFVSSTSARYSLKGSTYTYNAAAECQHQFTMNDETFLRQQTVRVPRNQDNGGGSSGSSRPGGGRGVSVHHTGGVSHGGGVGRRF